MAEVALPADLLAHGFKLIIRAPGRGFAVSPAHGCTSTKETLRRIIDEARDLIAFCEYVNRKKAEDNAVSRSSQSIPDDE